MLKLKRIVIWTVFFIAFFGIALATGWILGHRSVPTPKEITVTGNPTHQEEQQSPINIVMDNKGHATGQAQIKPINGLQSNEDSVGWNIPPISFGDGGQAPVDFGKGFTATGPISGEIQTTVINKRTGDELWSGNSPLTGTVTATSLDGQNVGFDIKFDNEQTYAIDLPKEPPKRYEVGLLVGIDIHGKTFVGGYGRANLFTWELGKVEIAPWVGATGVRNEDGLEGYLLVGVGGRF